MNERESDPTGAFRGGSAGLDDGSRAGSDDPEVERAAPGGAAHGGGQSSGAEPNSPGERPTGDNSGVDGAERDVITSGTAATSEVADRDAQTDAERHGDGTPRPG